MKPKKNLVKLSKKIPKRYYLPLNKKDKYLQLQELDKSRKMYRQQKYYTRKKMSSFNSKPSRHVVDFKTCYGINISSNLKTIEKVTGVSVEVCQKILNKGRGAYYSSGSRPNQTAESWARARLASAILKRGAYKIDKHIFIKHGSTSVNKCRRIKSINAKSTKNQKKDIL